MSHRGNISDQSQEGRILAHLQTGAELSPLEALDKFGCFRLGARIYTLRKEGVPIESRTERHGRKFWFVYRLGGIAHG